MADSPPILIFAALLPLAMAACQRLPQRTHGSSVTVKLPPARLAMPQPGFAFDRVRQQP